MNRTKINWPDTLTEKTFKRKYWQKKPVLIRNLFPKEIATNSPVSKQDIIGLSKIESVPTKCVYKRKDWHVKHGPLTKKIVTNLRDANWTILVDKVNTQLSDADRFFHFFNFIDLFRLKDLMVSLSNNGGSVGPHYDSYDVFLVQGHGQKLWQLSSNFDPTLENNPDLKILKTFKAEEEFILNPGDTLYLPPNIAHNGISLKDDSITYSIGFKHPAILELTDKVLFYHMDNISSSQESSLKYFKIKTSRDPLDFSDEMINYFAEEIIKLMPNYEKIKKYVVKTITESDADVVNRIINKDIKFHNFLVHLNKKDLYINPAMKAVFWKDNLFYDGEELDLSALSEREHKVTKTLLKELIENRMISSGTIIPYFKFKRALKIIFFLYRENLLTFKKLRSHEVSHNL